MKKTAIAALVLLAGVMTGCGKTLHSIEDLKADVELLEETIVFCKGPDADENNETHVKLCENALKAAFQMEMERFGLGAMVPENMK